MSDVLSRVGVVENNVLNSVANLAILDGILLLPHKEGKFAT